MTKIYDLMRAANAGDEAKIKALLRHPEILSHRNLGPSFRDILGQTALTCAANQGHASCVQLLLPLSNALAVNSAGDTALMRAAHHGHTACVELLLPFSNALMQNRNGTDALMYAANHGQAACVQLLLPVSDPTLTDLAGWTALIYAAFSGHLACTQTLLPVSHVLAKNRLKQTASYVAHRNDHFSVADLIDAYTYAMSERDAIHQSTASSASSKKKTLRM